jgi:hypothetical protein
MTQHPIERALCNLPSFTKDQQAFREVTRTVIDKTGNLRLFPGIFPDYSAPVVRNTAEGRELTLARWGMPSPVFALKGRNSDPGVTNVRNVARLTGADGLAPRAAASCRGPAFQRTRRHQMERRRRSGLHSMRPGPRLPRRHLDALDFCSQGQGRRNDNDLYAFLTTDRTRKLAPST